jgi:hypothetical protein
VRWPIVPLATTKKPMTAVFCGVLALAQILAFAHLATVGHQTCLEHGEAIHTGIRTASTAAPAQSAGRIAFESQASDSEGHEHEHCLSAAHGRAKLVLPVPVASGVLVLCPVGATSADSTRLLFAGVDLLALAPKGSPPIG